MIRRMFFFDRLQVGLSVVIALAFVGAEISAFGMWGAIGLAIGPAILAGAVGIGHVAAKISDLVALVKLTARLTYGHDKEIERMEGLVKLTASGLVRLDDAREEQIKVLEGKVASLEERLGSPEPGGTVSPIREHTEQRGQS